MGTFSGYSAICMAEGLEEGGKLYTFEINDEMEDFTRPWIEGSPVADKIDFRIGDAAEEAPKLGILLIWLSLMVTNAIIQKYMRSCCPSSGLVAISSLTTHCGIGTSLTLPTTTTNKQLASDVSMTLC